MNTSFFGRAGVFFFLKSGSSTTSCSRRRPTRILSAHQRSHLACQSAMTMSLHEVVVMRHLTKCGCGKEKYLDTWQLNALPEVALRQELLIFLSWLHTKAAQQLVCKCQGSFGMTECSTGTQSVRERLSQSCYRHAILATLHGISRDTQLHPYTAQELGRGNLAVHRYLKIIHGVEVSGFPGPIIPPGCPLSDALPALIVLQVWKRKYSNEHANVPCHWREISTGLCTPHGLTSEEARSLEHYPTRAVALANQQRHSLCLTAAQPKSAM